MEDIILYHGSRGGIKGDIKPISRPRCDFGRGFYMGDSALQAKGLISHETNPVIYQVKFKLSEIPEKKILKLDGQKWLYAVLACRKNCREFNFLKISKIWIEKLSHYDVIIGTIADDRINEAIKMFRKGLLTDKGLIACLQTVDYGNQYVAKTDFACSKIEKISERKLFGRELDVMRKYSFDKKIQSEKVVGDVMKTYCKDGKYIEDIIKDEMKKQKGGIDYD